MRQSMSWRLCMLEQVYHETEIGRELTEDEQLERFTNWGIGVTEEALNAYYSTCGLQQEAEERSGLKMALNRGSCRKPLCTAKS